MEKLSTKHSAQSFDGKQKVFARRSPAAVIEGQGAGRDQTVQMKMVFERLIPGMKQSGNPQSSAKTPLAKLKERFADRFEEKS